MKKCALHALGGMGKSTAVAEYAKRHWEDYQAVFWVDAGTDTLASSFERLARLLGVPGWESMESRDCRDAILRALSRRECWPKP